MLGYRGHFSTKSRRYSTTLQHCAPRALTGDAGSAQDQARPGQQHLAAGTGFS
jgi:hypothetical protein